MKDKLKALVGVSLIVISILGLGFLGFFYFTKRDGQKLETALKKTFYSKGGTERAVSPLDGRSYPKDLVELNPLAIVVENHPDARPQSGLGQANIVYEFITEGGITRFLAIFNGPEVKEIGPIRSARNYFIDIAEEYKSILVHAGGAANAIQRLQSQGIKHLNHTQGYFVRKPRAGIAVEHTLYSDTAKLYSLAKKMNYLGGRFAFDGFKFKSESKLDSPQDFSLIIDFSDLRFKVKWQYQKESNVFLRYQANLPHIDKLNGKQIEAKNLIIQYVKSQPVISGDKEVLDYVLIGGGRALVLIDGSRFEALWKKEALSSKTRFFNKDGREIKLNPGPVWIEVLSQNSTVSFE